MGIVFLFLITLFYLTISFSGVLLVTTVFAYIIYAGAEKLKYNFHKDDFKQLENNPYLVKTNYFIKTSSEYVFFALSPIHGIFDGYVGRLVDYIIPPTSFIWTVLPMVSMFVGGGSMNVELPSESDDEDEVDRKLEAILDETELENDREELMRLMQNMNENKTTVSIDPQSAKQEQTRTDGETAIKKPRLYSEDMVRVDVNVGTDGVTSNSLPNTPTSEQEHKCEKEHEN